MKCSVMILFMGLFCMSNMSYAGNGDLSVGGTLEMTSSANGFLPPRMTTSARGNIAPSPGMLIYNTDDNAYNYYTSSGWKNLAAGVPVHDNNGASNDYALAVGETAKITYASATSVPLHIAVSQGEYEVTINGTYGTTSSVANSYLSANNGSLSGFYTLQDWTIGSNNTIGANNWTGTTISIGDGNIIKTVMRISTITNNKNVLVDCMIYAGSQYRFYKQSTFNSDTTTAWTSLGAITFAYSQSGNIIIRRIL